MDGSTLSRRRLLAAGGLLGGGGLIAACSSGTGSSSATTKATTPTAPTTRTIDGVTVPIASWVIAENERPGTLDWILSGYPPAHGLEGYTNKTSAPTGGDVEVMVNTTDASFRIEAYRMGWYHGKGGRLIASSPTLPGVAQPAPLVDGALGTVQCQWAPSWKADLTGWPPGFYLFRLLSAKNWQQWIPFVVRADTSMSAFVLMSSVTTFQAYNTWGGWSLYKDDSGSSAKRARVVSFDRPIDQDWEQGAADFFGNEFPVLYDMERRGLDLDYWTDMDLHERGHLLSDHQCLVSLGHDEYWSSEMRGAATSAMESGTNLAFLGANAIYRKCRFEPSATGVRDRLEVNYKDATDPGGITSNWSSPPANEPESLLTGSTYVSIDANDDLVIVDPKGWFWRGTGVTEGQHLSLVVQGEYNRFIPGGPGPQNVQLFGHSPITAQGTYADITYVTRPNQGGIISMGMASFVYKLSNSHVIPAPMVPDPIEPTTPILLRAMLNLYGLFGMGVASATEPSKPNWQHYD